MRRPIFPLALAFTFIPFPALAQDKPPTAAERTQRLASVGKLWGAVRYLHPHLTYRDSDWDAALVKALPKIMAAGSDTQCAAAVQEMLAALGDPVSRVLASAKDPGPGEAAPKQVLHWLDKETLLVDLRDGEQVLSLMNPHSAVEFHGAVAKARAVIIDLRGDVPGLGALLHPLRLHDALASKELPAISQRFLVHSGYQGQRFYKDTGIYHSAFQTKLIEKSKPFGKAPPRSVFLVNEKAGVPALVLALQEAGDSMVVAEGKPAEDVGTSLPLFEGFEAVVRTSEMMLPGGAAIGFEPDLATPADGDRGRDGPAFKAALSLLKDGKLSKRGGKAKGELLPPPLWRADKAYTDMAYPDVGHRVLALYRFWNVIHHFYPYKHLLDQDWDSVLVEFLPRFIEARNAREYALAIQEMATRVPDGHTWVNGSQELRDFFGVAPAPLGLRWLEDSVVVTELRDEKAKAAGVKVGDVVVAVDGVPVEKRLETLTKYTTASTPLARKQAVLMDLLRGAEGSTCKLVLRGADGKPRDVELPRRSAFGVSVPRPHAVFDVLPGNVGYVDLERLLPEQVEPMFAKLKDTRAIVFDLRGYPNGTMHALALRFNVKKARFAAHVQRPLVSGDGLTGNFSFMLPLPPSAAEVYRGKVVTLIDERAQSQSETTAMFLSEGCGATFVGSPTSGANGDVTDMILPGGISVIFSGHDMRHVDGRQLQRVGVVPHIAVRPTIAGVRAGQDEVLQRALECVEKGK